MHEIVNAKILSNFGSQNYYTIGKLCLSPARHVDTSGNILFA